MADLLRPEGYEPREQFSPSGLGLASMCEMAWFFRYVLGQKESDLLDWSEAKELTRPEKPDQGPNLTALQLAAYREDVKEYNRLTRRALGHAVHNTLAIHYDWHPPLALIDWTDRPGFVAVTGLPFLPAHEDCEEIHVEQELTLDWGPDDDPLHVRGFADLIVRLLEQVHKSDVEVYAPGAWVLVDHKTTYTFDYVPLQSELEADVAACFYALAVMVKLGLPELQCRWVYFLTDEKKPEDSRAVTFRVTRDQAVAVLTPVETLALKLRLVMRQYVSLVKRKDLRVLFEKGHHLKHNPVHCANMYGAPCVYHFEQGGDCRPPRATSGQRMVHLRRKDAQLGARREFQRSLGGQAPARRKHRDARNGQSAGAKAHPQPRSGPRPTPPHSARHETTVPTTERELHMAGKFDAAPEPGAATAATTTAGTRAPRTPKAPKAAEVPPIFLVSGDDVRVEVPPGSPLHAKCLAVLEALYS